MGFGATLLFWNHPWFYHASCGKFSQNPSLHFGATQTFCSNRFNPSLNFISIILFPKNNFVHYSKPRWFTKEVPDFLWVLISNQLLWIVPSTPNLEPSRSTLPLFKISKFQPLQVWTRFIIFGEIHIFLSPKIPPKIRQPQVLWEATTPKISPR